MFLVNGPPAIALVFCIGGQVKGKRFVLRYRIIFHDLGKLGERNDYDVYNSMH